MPLFPSKPPEIDQSQFSTCFNRYFVVKISQGEHCYMNISAASWTHLIFLPKFIQMAFLNGIHKLVLHFGGTSNKKHKSMFLHWVENCNNWIERIGPEFCVMCCYFQLKRFEIGFILALILFAFRNELNRENVNSLWRPLF